MKKELAHQGVGKRISRPGGLADETSLPDCALSEARQPDRLARSPGSQARPRSPRSKAYGTVSRYPRVKRELLYHTSQGGEWPEAVGTSCLAEGGVIDDDGQSSLMDSVDDADRPEIVSCMQQQRQMLYSVRNYRRDLPADRRYTSLVLYRAPSTSAVLAVSPISRDRRADGEASHYITSHHITLHRMHRCLSGCDRWQILPATDAISVLRQCEW